MKNKLAVLGNPVAHSLSPQIHEAFASQAGLGIQYDKIHVEAADFNSVVKDFFAAGGRGLNVTLPHKTLAFELAEELSPEARVAGAVNTLSIAPNGKLRGENTDGAGLLVDIRENLGWSIKDARVLVLGAGGAAQGVIADLLKGSPESIAIANRTISKAEAIVNAHGSARLVSLPLTILSSCDAFDLIISASSAGLRQDSSAAATLPENLKCPNTCCYDMIYGQATDFLRWSSDLPQAQRADGLGMLVEQAAKSFHIWFGANIETAPVHQQLRSQLDAKF